MRHGESFMYIQQDVKGEAPICYKKSEIIEHREIALVPKCKDDTISTRALKVRQRGVAPVTFSVASARKFVLS